MEWAVEVEDMTVAYTTKPVLWDVDMKVPIGSLAAIVGPNGAGKSHLVSESFAAECVPFSYRNGYHPGMQFQDRKSVV